MKNKVIIIILILMILIGGIMIYVLNTTNNKKNITLKNTIKIVFKNDKIITNDRNEFKIVITNYFTNGVPEITNPKCTFVDKKTIDNDIYYYFTINNSTNDLYEIGKEKVKENYNITYIGNQNNPSAVSKITGIRYSDIIK